MNSRPGGIRGILLRIYPNIRLRVTAPFLVTIVATATIGVFIVTRLVAGSIQERLDNQLISSARAAASATADLEERQLETLRLMAFTEGLAPALIARDTDSIDALLRPIAANFGAAHVIVFDPEGEGILHIERSLEPESITYIPSAIPDLTLWGGVQRVVNLEVDLLGDKFVDLISVNGNLAIFISAPVVDAQNVMIGGLTLGIDSADFSQRISEQSLSSVILYDNEGDVIGSTYSSLVLNELRLPANLLSAVRVMPEDMHRIELRTFGGLDYQVLYAPLLLRGERVGIAAVALPVDFVTERISSSRDALAVLFAALFAVITVLGVNVSRSIVNPVQRLVRTTEAILAGDLTRRVGLKIPDELGRLSQSFDHMTDQLVARNREIEALYRNQLQETARRQAILTSISDAMLVVNARRKVFIRNPAADHLMARLKGHPAAADQFRSICRRPETVFTPQSITLVNRHYSVLATPVRNESGALLGHVVVFRDITPVVEAEQLKDRIVLQISHELRTPLSAARGYVELLEMMGAGLLQREHMDILRETQMHIGVLQRMIDQVIEVSAIISGRLELVFDEFDLSTLIARVFDKLKAAIQNRRIEVELFLLSGDHAQIEADKRHIGVVVENLLHNAYSYTLPGGRIQVRMERFPQHVAVTIADTGVGIDADEIDRVFEQMYRGRSADAGPTDARGLGLGLYFAKTIVEAHGGSIELRSEVNAGTQITFSLPLRQPEPLRQPGNSYDLVLGEVVADD